MHLVTSSKHVSRETNVRRCNKSTGAPWTKTTSRNLKLTREDTHTCADATKEDRPGNPETCAGSQHQESEGGPAQQRCKQQLKTQNPARSESQNRKARTIDEDNDSEKSKSCGEWQDAKTHRGDGNIVSPRTETKDRTKRDPNSTTSRRV